MKNFIADFIKRLTSRKFLLAVAVSCLFAYYNQYSELVAIVLGYFGAEGAGDVVERYAKNRKPAISDTLDMLNNDDDFLNKDMIVPGTGAGQMSGQ